MRRKHPADSPKGFQRPKPVPVLLTIHQIFFLLRISAFRTSMESIRCSIPSTAYESESRLNRARVLFPQPSESPRGSFPCIWEDLLRTSHQEPPPPKRKLSCLHGDISVSAQGLLFRKGMIFRIQFHRLTPSYKAAAGSSFL